MQYLAIRAAVHIAAVLSIYLSAAMLIPAAVDLYYGNPDWQVFAFSALFTGGLGLAVMLATQGRAPTITARFGFLVVNLLWLTACAVGAVPLLASSLDLSFTDAVFEAVSGMTTTGATVITRLDDLPPGILIWRSLLQWFGGLGVIALGMFILPLLNVGGVVFPDRIIEHGRSAVCPVFNLYDQLAGSLRGADNGHRHLLRGGGNDRLRRDQPCTDQHFYGGFLHP